MLLVLDSFDDKKVKKKTLVDAIKLQPKKKITLYDYQDEMVYQAISSLSNKEKRKKNNPLLVAGTATGKSIMQAGIIKKIHELWGQQRVLCLSHSSEIIEQNARAFNLLSPEADLGIYSAKLGCKDIGNTVTFANIQSIANLSVEKLGFYRLCIIDEAHAVPQKKGSSNSQYKKLFSKLREVNPSIPILGLTATPHRDNNKPMIYSPDTAPVQAHPDYYTFTHIAHVIPESLPLELGKITPLTSNTVQQVDMSGVRKLAGEYSIEDQGKVMVDGSVTEVALSEAFLIAKDRSKIMIFATTIEHAEHTSLICQKMGVSNCVITGKTATAERKQKLLNFSEYKYRVFISVGAFTTGYDEPNIDCIIFLRKTNSLTLFKQMCGRGGRKGKLINGNKEIKKNCLVLDFCGNIDQHGYVDDHYAGSKNSDKDIIKCKTCGTKVNKNQAKCHICATPINEHPCEHGCGGLNHPSVSNCHQCKKPINRTPCPVESCGHGNTRSAKKCAKCGVKLTNDQKNINTKASKKSISKLDAMGVTHVTHTDISIYKTKKGSSCIKVAVTGKKNNKGRAFVSTCFLFPDSKKQYPKFKVREFWKKYVSDTDAIPTSIKKYFDGVNTVKIKSVAVEKKGRYRNIYKFLS